jgi:hydroxyacylglutathione hydrolase
VHVEIVEEQGFQIKKLEVGGFENNCYILKCRQTGEGLIIDPASEAQRIFEAARETRIKYVLITHGHNDHIGALEAIRSLINAPVGVHPLDSKSVTKLVDFYIADGDIISFGNQSLKALHTPGHSPGSVCFLIGKHLFSGDTIFPGGPGNTSIPGSNHQHILKSIREKIFVLPDNTVIYPGHGLNTTVGTEKSTNFYEG